MPKVSIIVPVYNVEKYLNRCVKSLQNQTLTDIEIILVDDESPDNCPYLCDQYALIDQRIKVVHKKNGGLGMACNSGISAATGEYVAFCDSDDWVDETMYQIMYDTAQEHLAEIVYTGLKRVSNDGEITSLNHFQEKRIFRGKNEIEGLMLDMISSEVSDPIERHIQMSAKCVLYKRDLLCDYNIRFESERAIISEDLFFNLDNMINAQCIIVLPNVFYNYYINEQSLTSKVRLDRFEKNLYMRNILLNRYQFSHNEEFINRANRMFIGYNRTNIVQICNSHNLSFKSKIDILSEICSHTIWREIDENYPQKIMPLIHRLFYLLTLKRKTFLLFIVCKFKK